MNFEWNENTIRWYQEANLYTGFYKNLANLLAPSLSRYSNLCDIGCGLGLFSLEISPWIKDITCMDISALAINALIKSAEERQITNIKTKVMDCAYLEGSWDIIFMSFFCGQNLENFLPHCKKMILVITKENHPSFCPQKYKKSERRTADDVEKDLLKKGIPYSRKEASFEFGQPLRSLEEARSFVRTQVAGISEDDLGIFISQRLEETGRDEYPFFIAHLKSMGIFEIKGLL